MLVHPWSWTLSFVAWSDRAQVGSKIYSDILIWDPKVVNALVALTLDAPTQAEITRLHSQLPSKSHQKLKLCPMKLLNQNKLSWPAHSHSHSSQPFNVPVWNNSSTPLAKTETDLKVCNYSHREQSSIRLSSIRLHASTGHQDPTIEVQCAALDCPMEHHRISTQASHAHTESLSAESLMLHLFSVPSNAKDWQSSTFPSTVSHSLFFDTWGSASAPHSYWSTYTKRTNSQAPYTRGLLSVPLPQTSAHDQLALYGLLF